MRFPINEVFETVQGEGYWTGTPALFIRFQGCPVGCPWCDTKNTWELLPQHYTTLNEILAKEDSGSSAWGYADADELVAEANAGHARHIVLTGGEPAMWDLTELSKQLYRDGHRVQIETSGTYPIKIHDTAWVTLSPKIGMPSGRKVLSAALDRADEIKMPVGKQEDIDALLDLRDGLSAAVKIYVQPLSLSAKATALCAQAAAERGWKVSLQTHKLSSIR